MKQLEANRDRVIIEKEPPSETYNGGLIVLPDVCKDPPMLGKVISVGPGRTTDYGVTLPPDVKEGDRVLFRKYDGNNITIKGEKFLSIPEREILAVIEQNP